MTANYGVPQRQLRMRARPPAPTSDYEHGATARRAESADVSLEVRAEKFVVVLGASGCGKTTLLNMIGSLDSPSEGRSWWPGAPTSPAGRIRRARKARSSLHPLVSVPSLLLSGLMIPFDELSWPLQALARLVPLTYAEDVLVPVFRDGSPAADRLPYLALLAVASLTPRARVAVLTSP